MDTVFYMRCTPTSRILDEVLGLVTSDKIPFNLSQFSDSKTPQIFLNLQEVVLLGFPEV